jgi:hypothetical protein
MGRTSNRIISEFSRKQGERVKAIGKQPENGGLGGNHSVTTYFLSRVLYRVAMAGGDSYALKGGMLHYMRDGLGGCRPTSDIDLHAHDEELAGEIDYTIREMLTATVYDDNGEVDDGIWIDSVIPEGLAHSGGEGRRFVIKGGVGETEVSVKIDVGFGGVKPKDMAYKAVPLIAKNVPTAEMPCFPDWYVVSEKLHAIEQHGAENTRVRDYWDLRKFARMIEEGTLDRQKVIEAIVFTYGDRDTEIDADPFGLRAEFADEFREKTWRNWHNSRNWKQEGTLEQCVLDIQEIYRELLWEARLLIEDRLADAQAYGYPVYRP